MANYDNIVNAAAEKYGINPLIIHGIIQTESGGNPNAVGPKTKYGQAQGLTQILPDTQKRYGVTDPFNPEQAINATAAIMADNIKRYGNEDDAILAYHGGTSKANWGEKTKAYLGKVKGNMPQQEYAPDADPMWNIIAGKKPQEQAQESYKPDNDPMWNIIGGERVSERAASKQESQPIQASQTQESVRPSQTNQKPEQEKGLLQNLDDVTRATTHHISNALLGTTQLLSHAIAPESQFTNRLDQALQNREARYQGDISGGGWGSWVGAGIGELANPLNAALGARGVSAIASPLARGATGGALAGGMQPVTEGGDYAFNKSGQVALGSVLGGAAEKVAAPLIGKAADAAGNFVNRFTPGGVPARPMNVQEAKFEMANLERAKDAGEIAPEVADARMMELANGIMGKAELPNIPGQAKPQAPMTAEQQRAAEFAQLGMAPTKGQVTRDPAQYSYERNSRLTNPEVANRFAEQDQQLRNKLMTLGAATAQEPFAAGNALIAKISAADAPVKASVSAAYERARNMAGGDTNIPTESVVQRWNTVKDEFGDELIPTPVKNRLQAIADGEKSYTINDAEKLLKVINRNYKPNALDSRGQQQAAALDELRKGVKGSLDELTANDVGSEAAAAFGDARSAAAHRFRMIDNTPALKAVINEQANPDTFVSKFIINGDTNGIKSLSRMVRNDQEASGIVRSQIAEYLRSKGFGQDAAGDKQFAQESYNRAIKALGEEKLKAFFTPDEVKQLQLIGKVGSYIHQQPSGSTVNNSNTANVLMSIIDKIGTVTPLLSTVRSGVKDIAESNRIKEALNPTFNNRASGNRLGVQSRSLSGSTAGASTNE